MTVTRKTGQKNYMFGTLKRLKDEIAFYMKELGYPEGYGVYRAYMELVEPTTPRLSPQAVNVHMFRKRVEEHDSLIDNLKNEINEGHML